MSRWSNSFLLKRLFSLAGIVPIGAFVLQHFFSNAYVFLGPQAYNEHADFLTSLPLVVLIELTAIYLPIAFHSILGLVIIYRGQNNFVDYGYTRNWMYFGQRISGVIALIFIVTHTYTTRISSFMAGETFHYAEMKAILLDPFWFWFYVVGVLAVCFHFANGLWSFLVTWGVTVGPKAQRAASVCSWILFVGLGGLGIAILTEFIS
jgi:succinate dehydrogenase / fumarate reductase cytochrome b subunit